MAIDVNVNVKLTAGDELLKGISDLAAILITVVSANTNKKVTVNWNGVEKEPATPPPAPKANAVIAGKPVSPKENKAINDIISTPSRTELEDPEATLDKSELPTIREKVVAFTKSHDDGSAKIKKWLTAHGADRVTHIKRKDKEALLTFLEQGEAKQDA